ncbi:phage tail tape measure protein [Streptomyces xanthochromogenes]|uniref:phage tail tape measure protein n=1 Tax=Streptomyces xanthochromogenes TaxID=67384 RepID=UPI0016756617|nr:phage tail tape measure protein [Streptomyces xanthochromogenes]
MSEVADLFVRLRAETAPFVSGMTQAGASGETFTQRMGGLSGMLTKVGKATTVVGLGFVAYGVKAAGDFQQQMNLLVTACGESTSKLKMVSDGVLSLARETGTSTKELADGMYQVEKAGYRGADGLKVLKAAAQGAREEGASLKDVTNAMTSVMASYHLKASDSVSVMNAIKTAAGEGKITMEEFSGALSTVIPIASANKISFAQVGGAIATLTQHGTSAREATQELAATIRSLAAPNNVAVQEMQRLGLSSTDVSTKLGQRGLTGTLDLLSQTVLSKMGKSGTVLLDSFNKTKQASADLQTMLKSMPAPVQKLATDLQTGAMSTGAFAKAIKALPADQNAMGNQFKTLLQKTTGFNAELKKGGPAAQTYTEAIKKMAGGAIGLNTTLQLTGENTDGFKERVDKVAKSMKDGGKDVEGWDITQKSFNVQMGKLKEAVTTTAITIGTQLIPVILSVVSFFEQHKTATEGLAIAIGVVLTGSVLKFIAGAVSPLFKAVTGIAGVIKKVPWGSVASGASSAFDTMRLKGMYAWDGLKSGASKAGTAVANFGRSVGTAAASAGRAAWSGLASGISTVGTAMRTAALASLDFMKSMAASAVAGLRAAAAWTAQKIALIATTVAEKAAAVAQWALNVAMDANPISLIILALAALVAAIVFIAVKTTWFQTAWTFTWNAIKTVGLAVWNALKTAFAATINFFVSIWQTVSSALAGAWSTAWNAIKAVASVVWNAIKSAIANAIMAIYTAVQSRINELRSMWNSALNSIKSIASSAWNSIRSTITNAINSARQAVQTAVAGILNLITGIQGKVMGALRGAGSWLVSAGRDIINGLLNGIESAFGKVQSTLSHLTSLLPSWKGPPARDRVLLHGAGQMIIEGLVNGMNSRFANVQSAAVGIAQGTVSAFADELEIRSPSRKFAALGGYVMHGLLQGLTGSTASVKTATTHIARSLYVDFGTAQKSLQRLVANDNSALLRLANNRDSVAARIKAAQSSLTSLQKDWTKERDAVSAGMMQNVSIITASPDATRPMAASDVLNSMSAQVAKATQFAADLQVLRSKGLSTDQISQLATAGVDQAGATATALAAASKSQIMQMNTMRAGMQKAANGTGAAVADSMYGAGIQSAQGLIKGLQSQEKAIQAQMVKIAKSMQSAIKKALGIRSPSRVFADLGQFVPQGLAQGIQDATHHATTAARGLATAVTGAGALGTPGLAMGGGGATIINNYSVTISAQGSILAERDLRDKVEQQMVRLGARNSQTWQSYQSTR